MAVDLTFAVVPALLGTATGIGFAYWIYKQTIEKWYGEERKSSIKAKVMFWVGIVSCTFIAQGVMQIGNEIFYLLLNNGNLKQENLFKGVIFGLIVPLILFSFAKGITKLMPEKSSISKIEISNEDAKEGVVKNGNSLKIIGCIIAIALVFLALKDLQISDSEKTLNVGMCEYCKEADCIIKTTYVKKLKIDNEKIISFVEKNGETSIEKSPRDDEKCTIVKSENFMFQCEAKVVVNSLVTKFYTSSYNGKDKFIRTTKTYMGGTNMGNEKMTCEVN